MEAQANVRAIARTLGFDGDNPVKKMMNAYREVQAATSAASTRQASLGTHTAMLNLRYRKHQEPGNDGPEGR